MATEAQRGGAATKLEDGSAALLYSSVWAVTSGNLIARHEGELGPIQPDAVRRRRFQRGQIDQERGVEMQTDAHAIQGDRRLVAQGLVGAAPFGPAANDLANASSTSSPGRTKI